jgi:hypothetical protein
MAAYHDRLADAVKHGAESRLRCGGGDYLALRGEPCPGSTNSHHAN